MVIGMVKVPRIHQKMFQFDRRSLGTDELGVMIDYFDYNERDKRMWWISWFLFIRLFPLSFLDLNNTV